MISFHFGRSLVHECQVGLILRNVCRHHVFVKTPGDVQLAEVGPRFEMKRGCFSMLIFSTVTDFVSIRDTVRHCRTDGVRARMGTCPLLEDSKKTEVTTTIGILA